MSGRRRARLSAAGRVLLAMTVVLAVSIIVLAAAAYAVTERVLTAQLDQVLRREAAAYQAAVNGAPHDAALADATRAYLSARTASGTGRDVVLLAAFDRPTGGWRVISNSSLRLEDAKDNYALQSPPGSPAEDEVVVDGQPYLVLSSPIESNGVRVGVFQAAIAQAAGDEIARRLALTLASAGFIAFALGLPMAWWATRRSLAPLTQMAEDAEAVSHAEPGHRITYDGPPDELGSLAESLNAMLGRLERGYNDQRRFVADASHELRTPVAVIRGNTDVLLTGTLAEDDARESLEMIQSESERMARLLDELLALARFESTGRDRFQPLEVRTLVEEVAGRGKALGDRRFSVSGDCSLWIEGDPDLLDRALVNVVRNAVAHTAAGGTIAIECGRSSGSVRIAITDDGPGIAEADLPHVFERFYRAQAQRSEGASGAGLGMAIASRIAQLHGGTVSAENVLPHGARFTFELPAIDEPA